MIFQISPESEIGFWKSIEFSKKFFGPVEDAIGHIQAKNKK